MEELWADKRERIAALPLLTLPDYVLFPHTLVPFHIFDKRYLATLDHCLSGRRLIVVAGQQRAEDHGVDDGKLVAGLGRVVSDRRFRDGRVDLFVHGIARVRVSAAALEGECELVDVETILDVCPPDEQQLQQKIRDLALCLAQHLELTEGVMGKVLSARCDLSVLTDRLSAFLVDDTQQRQRLLEEDDVASRANLITELLVELVLHHEPMIDAEGIRLN